MAAKTEGCIAVCENASEKQKKTETPMGNLEDDTATLTSETQWFYAEKHRARLVKHMKSWQGKRRLF